MRWNLAVVRISAALGLAIVPANVYADSPDATSSKSHFSQLEAFGLPSLWKLTLDHNPELQQAIAEVEIARGRLIQAGKYPNPRFLFEQEALGASEAPAGTVRIQFVQEILTGGKRRLDRAIAARATDDAYLRLESRKFEVLTRVRRAYYEYVGWLDTARVNERAVESLQQALVIVRQLVETTKTRPVTDALRLEALLEEAKINRTRARISLQSAWRQLAAEVGVADLLPPSAVADLNEPVPRWTENQVLHRILSAHTDLSLASLQIDQARAEIDRARAEAVPNVQIGGGFSWSFLERGQGAIISLETPVPLWDRKQGRIHEANARLAQASAARQSAANRLTRETAVAFATYEGTRRQVELLQAQVLPRQRESLELLRKGYQAGSAQITFSDVFTAEEAVNDTWLRLSTARRELWRAVADLEGLMQLCLGEESETGPPPQTSDIRR